MRHSLVFACALLTACDDGTGRQRLGLDGVLPPNEIDDGWGDGYGVTGIITGLEGSGLVLEAGGESLAVTGTGDLAFAFVRAFADGATYEVVIASQPEGPTQRCTVTQGSGTIAAADVNDVVVSCEAAFRAKGTITGLDGTGLVISNGEHTLTPAAGDTTFAFGELFDPGAAYNVIIEIQPSQPGQVCTVLNGTGVFSVDAPAISISCVTPSFSVGGAISGVQSPGLSVALNGGTPLEVPAGASSFTFDTLFVSGEMYTVTLVDQPRDEHCTLSGGSGSTGEVVNVSVTCVDRLGPANPAAQGWNDYVKTATPSAACDLTELGGHGGCTHAGANLAVSVYERSTCNNLSATDALGAYAWTCDGSSTPPRMIGTLLPSIELVDLIDFAATGWKDNTVTVRDTGAEIYVNGPQAPYPNPVLAPPAATLDVQGAVYVLPTTGDFTLSASKIAVVVEPSTTHAGTLTASGLDYLWIEGGFDGGASVNALNLATLRGSVLHRIFVTGSTASAMVVTGTKNDLRDISVEATPGGGLQLGGTWQTLTNFQASNGSTGTNRALFVSGSHQHVEGVRIGRAGRGYAHSAADSWVRDVFVSEASIGLEINPSAVRNHINRVVSTNNTSYGVFFAANTVNNTVVDVLTTSNAQTGFYLANASSNFVANATTVHNTQLGFRISGVIASMRYDTLMNVASANNSGDGFQMQPALNMLFVNLALIHNAGRAVDLINVEETTFSGLLKVGNNTGGDCNVTGGTNPGLVTTTCANQGSSNATLTTGAAATTSFFGKVGANDTVNPVDDSAATAAFSALVDADAWTSFLTPHRVWGLDGGTFPATDNVGRCTTGNCKIWDFSAASGDTVLRNVLPLPALPAATHRWWAANATECALVTGAVWTAGVDTCTSSFLKNAVEMMGTGGNDNQLCELGETCLYTPNIGSYQGHGTLVAVAGGPSGYTLQQWSINGR